MLGEGWVDDDGRPLGTWVEINSKEAFAIQDELAGSLVVFSTLTDPDGMHGSPTVYTAWGVKGESHPRLDALNRDPTTWRKFVPNSESETA